MRTSIHLHENMRSRLLGRGLKLLLDWFARHKLAAPEARISAGNTNSVSSVALISRPPA
jgi:hypothetical protein